MDINQILTELRSERNRLDRAISAIGHAWAKTLSNAGLKFFVIYNLRHSCASRLSAAGVSDLFVAQMIGHSTPSILQKYSKAIDEYKRDAVRKLEHMRSEYVVQQASTSTSVN